VWLQYGIFSLKRLERDQPFMAILPHKFLKGRRHINMKTQVLLIALISIFTFAATSQADVTGKVTLDGKPARGNVKINTAADPSCYHEKPIYTKHWVVGPLGELANAVISIEAPSSGAPSSAKPLIDQKGCAYAPYVTAIQKGQSVAIQNSDATLHNVHGKADAGKGKSIFNFGQPVQGMKSDKKFDKAGVYKLKCDVHPWMASYVVVSENPYHAVSGKDGTFAIKDVPDGEYTVKVWHSRFKEPLTEKVTVKDGNADLSFTFDAV
jgi:plastocyanin